MTHAKQVSTFVSIMSFTATGTPSNTDSGAPARQRAADASACARTSASRVSAKGT